MPAPRHGSACVIERTRAAGARARARARRRRVALFD